MNDHGFSRHKAMAGIKLKSYEFRHEREQTWRELEALVRAAESKGIKSLSPDQLFRLPSLYRATVSSLSVARSISLDQNLVNYLESLSARAYFFVYGVRGSLIMGLAQFFVSQFPSAVRATRWHLLTAAAVLFLGVATGFALTVGNEDWFYTFVSAEYAKGRSPVSSTEELRAVLYDSGGAEALSAFASFLFTQNAKIGMLCFALGFAFGLPVILMLFYNGLTVGAFSALYASRGLLVEFWAWLSIHGTTELVALVLCGGAGLVLGSSLALPGRFSRLESLARNGRRASQIAIGAVVLFFLAGLLEGLGRQLITDPGERYLVAGVSLIWWALYFLQAGRARSHGHDR